MVRSISKFLYNTNLFDALVSSNLTSSPTVRFLEVTKFTIQSGISPFLVFSAFFFALIGAGDFLTLSRAGSGVGGLPSSRIVSVPGLTNYNE